MHLWYRLTIVAFKIAGIVIKYIHEAILFPHHHAKTKRIFKWPSVPVEICMIGLRLEIGMVKPFVLCIEIEPQYGC